MAVTSILWRRLDVPGHDACRLEQVGDGWRLEGTTVFVHDEGPARLGYRVACDRHWSTREGEVRGWIGRHLIELRVTRMAGGDWTLNGAVVPQLDECVDLDLGFTPATNLFQLRRLALVDGESAEVPVAWLDVPAATLEVLRQRYERRGATSYRYEAPQFAYNAVIEVGPAGFVTRYPGLWEAEQCHAGDA
jgi:hypothetical protein